MNRKRTILFSFLLTLCTSFPATGCNSRPPDNPDENPKLSPETNITDVLELSLTDDTYKIVRAKDAKIESVEIPDSYQGIPITDIGDRAFYSCFSLGRVSIPESITRIGDSAFVNCDALTTIELPDGVISIGNSAFEDCHNLNSVTLGNKLKTIGKSAFCGCENLSEISLPDGLLNIGKSAFEECRELTQITIPNTVTTIGAQAFEGCTKLTHILVGDSFDKIESISRDLFRDTEFYANPANWENNALYLGKTLLDTNGSVGEAYEIKQGTETIAQAAFWWNTRLKNVTIPQSVNKIGANAFGECTNLKHFYYLGTKAQWKSILKEENWDYNTGEWLYPLTTKYSIHCIDGDI